MLKCHIVSVMLLLALLPTTGAAQDAPEACKADSIEWLDFLHSWRAVMELGGAGLVEPPVRCLKIVLKTGEFVRAVATMETEPASSGVRILLHQPGKAVPALQLELGNVDRMPISWRAEASGPHYLVVRDAWTSSGRVKEVPVRIWLEQIEPSALADARMAALSADPRVAWLRQNVTPIRSIDPRDMDFSDLQPLRSALKEVRVVLLGEVDHASGSDFLAKSRLVKFLHRELGFDVLAFEAGLYGMAVAWDGLRSGAPPRQAFAEGAWGFWANSEQMQSLIDYVAEQARGDRPLELAGFDNQFTGQGASTRFAADLTGFLVKRGLAGPLALPAGPNMHILDSLAMRRGGSLRELPASTRSAFLSGLDQTIARVAALNDDAARFLTQVLRSTACHASFLAPATVESPSPACLRTQQMADNVIWLANERYPGRRIIIWSATAHAARTSQVPPAAGKGPPLALRVNEVFGSKSYAIGVTSYRSAGGHIVPDQHPLPEFEELMSAAGFDYGLIDLRRARSERNWAGEEFLARPIGHHTTPAVWSALLDALLFVREHQPRSPAR